MCLIKSVIQHRSVIYPEEFICCSWKRPPKCSLAALSFESLSFLLSSPLAMHELQAPGWLCNLTSGIYDRAEINVFMCVACPLPAFPTYGKPNPSACPDVWGHTLQETERQKFRVGWDLASFWGLSFLFWVKAWLILPASLPLLRMPGAKELYFCCADQVCLVSCGLFLHNSSFHALEKLWRERRDCK